jgi:hypothetical protein
MEMPASPELRAARLKAVRFWLVLWVVLALVCAGFYFFGPDIRKLRLIGVALLFVPPVLLLLDVLLLRTGRAE